MAVTMPDGRTYKSEYRDGKKFGNATCELPVANALIHDMLSGV